MHDCKAVSMAILMTDAFSCATANGIDDIGWAFNGTEAIPRTVPEGVDDTSIRHAAALGLDVDIGLVEKTKLLLVKTRHVVKHIPSMPWQEAPAFYQSLDDKSLPQLALRLLMLTGLRSHPVRHAHLDEINGDIWTIPGEKMKGRKGKTADFRVPLTPEALHVIELASQQQRDGHKFPGVKRGVISDASMARLMER